MQHQSDISESRITDATPLMNTETVPQTTNTQPQMLSQQPNSATSVAIDSDQCTWLTADNSH